MRKPRKAMTPPSTGGASVPKNRSKDDPKISFGRTGYIDFGVDPTRSPKSRPTTPKIPGKSTKKRTK